MITLSSTRLFAIVFFCAVYMQNSVYAATNAPKKKKITLISPANIALATHNYCKEIITALKDNNYNAVKSELITFFDKIPYTMRIKDRNFFSSLFITLLQSIGYQEKTRSFVKFKQYENYDSIRVSYLVNNLPCIFQVRVFDCKDDIKNDPIMKNTYYSKKQLDNEIEKNTVIACDYAINEKEKPLSVSLIGNNGAKKLHIRPKRISYDDNNIYKQLLINLHLCQEAKAEAILETIYANIPVELHIDSEKFYQSIFYCLLKFLGNGNYHGEVPTHHGRADILLHLSSVDCIIEFKFNKTRDEAIEQIDDRQYCNFLTTGTKTILKIGLNINKDKNALPTVSIICKEHQPLALSPIKKITH